MFSECITTTPFFNKNANFAFKNIHYDLDRYGDNSLPSTIRALFYSSMGEDDEISVNVLSLSSYRDLGLYKSEDTICVVDGIPGSDEWEAWSDGYEFFSDGNGADRVARYFQDSFKVQLYVNRSLRSSVMFVDNLSLPKLHYVQSAAPFLAPWYQQTTQEYRGFITELAKSFRTEKSAQYIAILEKEITKYDVRTGLIRNALSGIEGAIYKRQIRALRDKINQYNHDMKYYMDEYNKLSIKWREDSAALLGLEMACETTSGKNEIMEFALANPNFYLLNATDSSFDFGVKAMAEMYDHAHAETAINNPNSVIHTKACNGVSGDDCELLFRAIFLDETVKLRMYGTFHANLLGSTGCSSGLSDDDVFYDCLENPHIRHYDCEGGFRPQFEEAVQNNNYVQCIMIAQGLTSSIGFLDGSVLPHFVEDLCNTQKKCIILDNGEAVTPKKAIRYLKGLTGEQE